MKSMKSILGWLVCLFSAFLVMAPLSFAAEAPAVTVGRIFHIEGNLLRYVSEEKDWVTAVTDAPFGAEDTLSSRSNGMAELIVPNGIWIRIGNSTRIQFITLDNDPAEMDVASGIARFYNKGSQAAIKVTSPLGYVLADPGTSFDFYVGEKSIEVIAIKGTVTFVHSASGAEYEVAAGTPSVLADAKHVSPGEGTVDSDWNRWNMIREDFWLAKSKMKGQSVQYLPPNLHHEAYTFEENGRWEMVSYEGVARWFWRPTAVAVGWSPFTMGRWTDWYGDQTWIPAEPFGYTTHHYGNWIYANNYWYWAPPVVSLRIGFPLLDLGFFWSPGRVLWIHSGFYVGWFPLAPREIFYSHRHWGGPHTMVVSNLNINRINISIRNHTYAGHAVVIPQNKLYGVNNYRNIRVTKVNRTTVVNNYRTAPFFNKVILNYATTKQRYNYTNLTVKERPHAPVIRRIRHNETPVREVGGGTPLVLQERLKNIPEGPLNRQARIELPTNANRIVPVKETNRPKAVVKPRQAETRNTGKATPRVQAINAPVPKLAVPAGTARLKQQQKSQQGITFSKRAVSSNGLLRQGQRTLTSGVRNR